MLDGVTKDVTDGVCDGVCDGVWLFGKDSVEECPLTESRCWKSDVVGVFHGGKMWALSCGLGCGVE